MLLDFLFPQKCPYCGKPLGCGQTECSECLKGFDTRAVIKKTPADDICIAPFEYKGAAATAIKNFKFRGVVFNCRSLSAAAARAIKSSGIRAEIEVVTFVPMTKGRKRKRGFNQSQLLAKEISALLKLPCEELIARDKESEYQHKLGYEERAKHNKSYYRVKNPDRVRNRNILIVDDIMTTGATLSSCSGILKDNGAKTVYCAAAAIA